MAKNNRKILRKRLFAGSIAVVVVDNSDFRWTQGSELISTWKKPDTDWQTWFCRICGSPLPGVNDETRMFVPAGLLAGSDERMTVRHHIFVDSKASWDEIGDAGRLHREAFEG